MATSTIAINLIVVGRIEAPGARVEIHGTVNGDVIADTVVIHESGKTQGNVLADRAVIHGAHNGKLECSVIAATSTSVLISDVTAHSITTDCGAELSGNFKVTGNDG